MLRAAVRRPRAVAGAALFVATGAAAVGSPDVEAMLADIRRGAVGAAPEQGRKSAVEASLQLAFALARNDMQLGPPNAAATPQADALSPLMDAAHAPGDSAAGAVRQLREWRAAAADLTLSLEPDFHKWLLLSRAEELPPVLLLYLKVWAVQTSIAAGTGNNYTAALERRVHNAFNRCMLTAPDRSAEGVAPCFRLFQMMATLDRPEWGTSVGHGLG